MRLSVVWDVAFHASHAGSPGRCIPGRHQVRTSIPSGPVARGTSRLRRAGVSEWTMSVRPSTLRHARGAPHGRTDREPCTRPPPDLPVHVRQSLGIHRRQGPPVAHHAAPCGFGFVLAAHPRVAPHPPAHEDGCRGERGDARYGEQSPCGGAPDHPSRRRRHTLSPGQRPIISARHRGPRVASCRPSPALPVGRQRSPLGGRARRGRPARSSRPAPSQG